MREGSCLPTSGAAKNSSGMGKCGCVPGLPGSYGDSAPWGGGQSLLSSLEGEKAVGRFWHVVPQGPSVNQQSS